MFKGMGNMNQLMKQAQKMQADMQRAQEELANLEVVGTSGGGLVEVRLSGDKDLRGIKIAPSVVDPDDVEMLEDLVTAAFNEALANVDKERENRLGNMAGMSGMM